MGGSGWKWVEVVGWREGVGENPQPVMGLDGSGVTCPATRDTGGATLPFQRASRGYRTRSGAHLLDPTGSGRCSFVFLCAPVNVKRGDCANRSEKVCAARANALMTPISAIYPPVMQYHANGDPNRFQCSVRPPGCVSSSTILMARGGGRVVRNRSARWG